MKKMSVAIEHSSRIIIRSWVLVLAVALLLTTGSRTFSGNPVLDPDKIAGAETRMWQAYYARDLLRLHSEMAALLRAQFGVPPMDADRIARSLVAAAMKFAISP